MFQFTREFIINDNAGKLTGGKKFLTDSDVMYVDNMVNIRKKDVCNVYKHAYAPDSKETATFTLADVPVVKGHIYRLVITLGLEGKATALFNDYLPEHERHIFCEAIAAASTPEGGDSDAAVKAVIADLVKVAEKDARFSDAKFVKVEASGDNAFVITALDCYTRINEVRLVELPATEGHLGAVLTGYEDYNVVFDWHRKDKNTGKCSAFSAGDEGTGTVVRILKNMRLLTAANIDPYGLNMDERPVPGGKYDQYTIEMVTERHNVGHQVMGAIDQSLTTLVFFVLSNAGSDGASTVSASFEAALKALTGEDPIAATNAPVEEPKMAKAKDVEAVAVVADAAADAAEEAASVLDTTEATAGDVLTVATAGEAPEWTAPAE